MELRVLGGDAEECPWPREVQKLTKQQEEEAKKRDEEFIKNFTGDHEYYASKTKVWAQLCRLWPHLFVDAVVLVRR